MKCETCGQNAFSDSELQVSEDWLRSVGFHERAIDLPRCDYTCAATLVIDGEYWVRLEDTACSDESDAIYLPRQYKTRGDVRRLCRALGITLKEASDG